jgi:hypothetical protein
VTAELSLKTGFGGATANHLIGVYAMHRSLRQHPGSPNCRAEEGALVPIANAGRGDIFIEELLELVVCRQLVALAATKR